MASRPPFKEKGLAEDMAFLGNDPAMSFEEILEEMAQMEGDEKDASEKRKGESLLEWAKRRNKENAEEDGDEKTQKDGGKGKRRVIGISRDGKAMYNDGTMGTTKLTPVQVDNLQRTGNINGTPSGGGGTAAGGGADRYGNKVLPNGKTVGKKGKDLPGFGEVVPGAKLGPHIPERLGGPPDDKTGGEGGGGGKTGTLPPPRFPEGGTEPGPVFGGGGGLPAPTMPILGGGSGPPVQTGGPGGQGSNDIFQTLIESFDKASTKSNDANESRYNDILEGYSDRLGGAQNTLNETSSGLANAQGVMSDRWNRVGSALEAGEGNLERRFGETQQTLGRSEQGLMDILSGLGDQQREDINTRWDKLSGNQEQGLINRGLGNTTLRQNMLRGVEEGRGDELGRLRDSLAREQVGQGNVAVNRGLGLDTFGLGQAENAIGRRSEFGTQGQEFGNIAINQMLGQDQNRLAYPDQISSDRLDFMERRTDEGPDLNQLAALAFQFGAGGSGDFRPRPLDNQYTTNPLSQPAPQQQQQQRQPSIFTS